ncbi:MAG: ABC transporter ATP-binding protein [candidate division Zixibacteria bacterium]|nr:ABC transporter ATP-binding protein [candidate division Zixibacteria bacterium]
MAKVELKNVSKFFNKDNLVVKDINLDIQDGEFFTIVGPSGCGKSTILNMIAGLEGVTHGEILFDDQIVNDIPPAKRNVAMVFQSYALYPHKNVFENIAFPLRTRKVNRRDVENKVKEVARILGLESLLHKKPKELSGGQRQRVALGRAIVREPSIFLLDEPLSNLDAKLRIYMRAELKRLHRKLKVTTIYVTHDQAEAMTLSDRVALLFEGRIQQCDKPEVLYNNPTNRIVAEFIGSPAMNLIQARISENKERTEIIFDSEEKLSLPEELEFKPKDDSVLFGIRPEDVEVSLNPKEGHFKGELFAIEPTGSSTYLDILWNRNRLKAEVSPDFKATIDQNIYFSFNLNRCHLFDLKSGKNTKG